MLLVTPSGKVMVQKRQYFPSSDTNYTNGGTPVVNLSVASNRQKKDANGDRVSFTDWFRVTVFGRDAEIIAQYAKKGSALVFNGRLQTDSYVDREGQQRTSTYLIADSFEFVPTSKHTEENDNGNGVMNNEVKEEATPRMTRRSVKGKIDDNDIPF